MPDLHVSYHEVDEYITKDKSSIKELMHPNMHGVKNQSLAEATVPQGVKTLLHYHKKSEELYHILEGAGAMTLGNRTFEVNKGDTVCIPPTTLHCIENTGDNELRILCCCAPAYSHEDTVVVEQV